MNLEELIAFNEMLNEPPNSGNIITNPDGYKHIPISILEDDLKTVFHGLVQINKTQTQQLFNSVNCDAVISVWHPIANQWLEFSGTGTVLIVAVSEGRYKGSTSVVSVTDESQAPALAYSEAIKNAAKRIGKRFGADLNRDNTMASLAKSAYDIEPFNLATLTNKRAVLKAEASGHITKEQAIKFNADLEAGLKIIKSPEQVLINGDDAHELLYGDGKAAVTEVKKVKTPKSKK